MHSEICNYLILIVQTCVKMSRYPRSARATIVKCVDCNAPATRTVSGEFVCVECGETTIAQSELSSNGSGLPGQSYQEETTDESGTIENPENVSRWLVSADSAVEPTLSFVFPTRNEEDGVKECIERATEACQKLGLPAEIIVADNSTDGTADIARKNGAIVFEPDELGYGAAYQHAFRHVRGEYVVMGDADTTYDFTELPRLLNPIWNDDADMVLGSRFDGDMESGAMPALHRYVGNPLLTKFLNLFYNAGVSDAHSGFRVLTRDALNKLELHSTGMEFASEMIMEASRHDIEIEEVPISYKQREGEETLNSFQDGWRHVKFMLTNAPTHVFALPGVSFLVIGCVMMSLSLLSIQPSSITFGAHTMIAGSLLTIVGYQITLLAPFSSIAGNPVLSPTDPLSKWIENNLSLENGLSIGGAFLLAGALYGIYLLGTWLQGDSPPFVPADMVAFALIVIGLETIFSALHLSVIAGQRVPGTAPD